MSDRLTLRVDVLGTPFVTFDGAPVAVDTRKAIALLAVLALAHSAGQPTLARAELAELLWPEVDEARARATLRRTLSALRAATGPCVAADRTSVWLTSGVICDVVTFRTLAASGEREDLARAVGLVRGELLAGFVLRDCPAFDTWVSRESDTLRRELGGVLERLVLARLQHRELHAALADAARWLELDPLHEAAHRSLMRLLAWTGRRQDALDHYRRCVRVLGDELGVTPVRATTKVYEAIRAGTLPPPRSRPAAVGRPDGALEALGGSGPARADEPDGSPMVGRDAELASLRAATGQPGRLVLITGESGVGRSRLVEEFAAGAPVALARAHSGEALSFAPVADLLRSAVALGRPLADDIASAIARLIPEVQPADRPPEPPLDSPGARDQFYDAVLRTFAGCGAAAVVLEDVHNVGSSSAEVLAYLVHRLDRLPCPLVLTWRDPGLPERHPIRVAIATGLRAENATTITLTRLSRDDVAALAEPAGVDADAVWRDTAGLPLLVVAALRHGIGDLLMTVRDLLANRLAEVSEETAQVLATLAVLNGRADPSDLHAASGRTEVETVEAIEEALRAGLIREENSEVAFTHDVLRRVAYEQLSLLRRRLLHHRAADILAGRRDATLRAGAIATHLHLSGRDAQAAAWAWRAAERALALYAHDDALHYLDFAASLGRDDAAVSLARGDVLVALGRYQEARAAYTRASALSDDPSARAAIERRQADIAARLGEWALAASGLEAALSLAVDDSALSARLLADRALVAVRSGDLAAAAASIERALAMSTDDRAYVVNVCGVIALETGDAHGAIDAFERALDSLVDVPDAVLEAAARNNLATAQAAAGRNEAAVATARDALELGARLGDRHRLAALHANLADRLHEIGETALALEHLKQSAALFAELAADPLDRPDVWTLTAW